MDDEQLRLPMIDGEYVCPWCLKKGKVNNIMAFQISPYEALYGCQNLMCPFPWLNKRYYVRPFQRHYRNMQDPIKYPQVFYGPLPYFEGCSELEEDEDLSEFVEDWAEERAAIIEICEKISKPLNKCAAHEEPDVDGVDELLNSIFEDVKDVESSQLSRVKKLPTGVNGVSPASQLPHVSNRLSCTYQVSSMHSGLPEDTKELSCSPSGSLHNVESCNTVGIPTSTACSTEVSVPVNGIHVEEKTDVSDASLLGSSQTYHKMRPEHSGDFPPFQFTQKKEKRNHRQTSRKRKNKYVLSTLSSQS